MNLVNNKLSVDFSQMPTDKFEALLKTIRVPIWLEKNTNFYVNGSTGSNTLDEGRGLSASKPFKTIQACVNYICDNYNLSRYNAVINIAAGTYNEYVTLSSYTATTGTIQLIGEDRDSTIITRTNGNVVIISRANYTLKNLTVKLHVEGEYSSYAFYRNIGVTDRSSCTLNNISCVLTCGSVFTGRNVYMVLASGSSSMSIVGLNISAPDPKIMSNLLYAFNLEDCSVAFNGSGDSTVNVEINISGEFTRIFNLGNKATVNFNMSNIYDPKITGSPKGQKYRIENFSEFTSSGLTIPGTADGSTEQFGIFS